MNFYVTDTHALNWYLTNDKQLSRRANAIFEDAEAGHSHIFVPVIVLAEIMFLAEKGRTKVQYAEALEILQENPNYTIVDVTLAVLEKAVKMQDALEIFDRLIAATAILYEAPLITRDAVLSASKQVETIW